MRVKDMKRLPFSIFKRANSRHYYVKFKNEKTGAYLPAISTKQESEQEAIKTAFEWFTNGIPQRGESLSFKQYSLRDMAKALIYQKRIQLSSVKNWSGGDCSNLMCFLKAKKR